MRRKYWPWWIYALIGLFLAFTAALRPHCGFSVSGLLSALGTFWYGMNTGASLAKQNKIGEDQ